MVFETHGTLLFQNNSLQNPFDHVPYDSSYLEITASVKPMTGQSFEGDRILMG